MQERVTKCEWTNARQQVETDVDLPDGWVEIPLIRIGNGTEESEDLEDLHFLNFDALSKWAASKALTAKLTVPSARVWTSDQR